MRGMGQDLLVGRNSRGEERPSDVLARIHSLTHEEVLQEAQRLPLPDKRQIGYAWSERVLQEARKTISWDNHILDELESDLVKRRFWRDLLERPILSDEHVRVLMEERCASGAVLAHIKNRLEEVRGNQRGSDEYIELVAKDVREWKQADECTFQVKRDISQFLLERRFWSGGSFGDYVSSLANDVQEWCGEKMPELESSLKSKVQTGMSLDGVLRMGLQKSHQLAMLTQQSAMKDLVIGVAENEVFSSMVQEEYKEVSEKQLFYAFVSHRSGYSSEQSSEERKKKFFASLRRYSKKAFQGSL